MGRKRGGYAKNKELKPSNRRGVKHPLTNDMAEFTLLKKGGSA